MKTDVADPDQVQAAVDTALGLGPLRALVNAAGLGNANRTVNREGKPFPLDQFEFVIRVNLIGTFNCLRLAAAAMSQQEPVDDRRAARRHREHRVGGGLRRPDRPGRLLRLQGRRRRAHAAGRSGPLGHRHPGQHDRARV